MPSVDVRPAETADLDALATIWRDAWRDAHLAIVPAELAAARTWASFRERLARALDDTRVVGPVGAPLGFCTVKGDELYQLFVSAAARGGGVAAALIADAEARLAARGVTVAWLACAIGNDRAARFYEKSGWTRARTWASPLELPGGATLHLEVWVYEKRLAGERATLSHFEEIYARHADRYDELVRAEDCDGNLVPALDAIRPLDGAAVLEVGVGTGRIARAIAGRIGRLVAVERAKPMLAVARASLAAAPIPVALAAADGRALPVASGWADLAVAGWVFGHFREWMPDGWRAEAGRALDEMARALRPGGALVIIETLGTGSVEPGPPTPGLAEYYAWLEDERGLVRRAIRTDYQFASVDEAARVTGFFFGEAFAARVRAEGWTRVPEQTGIWSLSR